MSARGLGKISAVWIAAACFLASSALFASGRRREEEPEPVTTPAAPAPTPAEEKTVEPEVLSAVWIPDPADDLLMAAEFLESRPDIRVTVVAPDTLFSDNESLRRAWQILSKLAARGQIEIALALAGDPPLALILDSDLAKISTSTVQALPPRFSWPDDVVGHVADARAVYRRRWRADAKGVVLPGGLVAGPELAPLQTMNLQWALLVDGDAAPGYYGGTAVGLVKPFALAGKSPKSSWGAWRSQAYVSPAVDGQPGAALLPPLAVPSLSDFAEFTAAVPELSSAAWALVSEVVASPAPRPEWDLGRHVPDFSPWIGEPEENSAWRLLGVTRRAVEDYKNSGQAELKNLDLALREVHNAEGGRYTYFFGNDFNSAQDGDLAREFMASLAQVYRLMGQNVPNSLLIGLPATASASDTGEESAGTKFEKTEAGFRWVDASKDDRGPGDFFYPTSPAMSAGTWDLRSFEVRPADEAVGFVFETGDLSNPWAAPSGFSGTLLDVYVDINRLPGAGAETLLPGRPGIVETQNAWEYALSVTGWGARLYQFNPGSEFKVLARLSVKKTGPSSFRVDVPRKYLRGDPDRWGYGVVVMGHDPAAGGDPGDRPMRVGTEPGARRFGGAWVGTAQASSNREAPPFIDLLSPPGGSQQQSLSVYKQGRDVVIPFVRAEAQ